jgi:4'-phosphopantetheinyl transferase
MQWDGTILYGAVSQEEELELWVQRFCEGSMPLVLAVDLRTLPMSLDCFKASLSAEEETRIQRLLRAEDRARATVSRGLLRVVLARLKDCRVDEVELLLGTYGKPHLAPPMAVEFSVSRSGDYVMLAMARERRIGIDVERIRSLTDFNRLLSACLTPDEQMEMALLSGTEDRQLAFFSAWTQKEAFLKGIGCGLSLAPTAVRVNLLPHAPPCLLQVDGMADAATAWQMLALPPIKGYSAALAVEQRSAL